MPLHLKSIHLSNLGPLAKFDMEFGLVNLIYGPNESGKTQLVEFIIQSIFHTKKIWQLRDIKAQGIVKVIGDDGGELDFTPSKKPKLDDILVGNHWGISSQLSHLLIVKGAELDLSDKEPAGVGYDFIGQVLSSSRLCHTIQEKLSDSMKKGQIEGKSITGPNNSEYKKRQGIKQELENFERLLDQVNRNYSSGELAELRIHVQQAQSRFENVNASRRHHAYLISQRKVKLQGEISHSPMNEATELAEKFRDYQRRIQDNDEQRERAEQAASHCKQYAWLGEAIQSYEKLLLMIPKKPGIWLLFLSLISFILGLVFIFLHQQYPAAISVSFAVVFAVFYIYHLHKFLDKRNASDELVRLAHSYQELFGEPLGDVAQLRAHYDDQKRSYDLSEELERQVNSRSETLKNEEVLIAIQLQRLTGVTFEEQVWGDRINNLLATTKGKVDEIRKIDLELAGMSVNPAEYLADDPGGIFESGMYQQLYQELEKVKDRYKEKENELQILKQHICTLTCQEISISWEDIIHSLRLKYQDKVDEYRRISAELIAGILVNQELEHLKAEERHQIEAGLKEKTIKQPLFELTGHYQEIELEGNELIVNDGYNRIRLSDLSTGAREQVLLALRMGFAARILGQDSAFMILDDAFQHSDWNRREKMLDHITRLAQSGWQVIYFSMDDHIRDLFKSRFSTRIGMDYIFKSL